jgi:HEAT repeat protein
MRAWMLVCAAWLLAGSAAADPPKEITRLIQDLGSPEDRVVSRARERLIDLDSEAVPALADLLRGKDGSLRIRAAQVAGSMATVGQRHAELLAPLADAARAADPRLRYWAASALSQTVTSKTVPPANVIPALVECLSDPDGDVRCCGVAGLVNLDRAAVPALQELLRNKEVRLRLLACRVACQMGDHGRRHPELRDLLAEAARSADRELSERATAALRRQGLAP